MHLIARFRRWLHCLVYLHRPVDGWINNETYLIGCECGKAWYFNKERMKIHYQEIRREAES